MSILVAQSTAARLPFYAILNYMFKNKQKHQRIYIALTVLIFALVACGHILILGSGKTIAIGYITLPSIVNLYAVVIALLMLVMGGYYLLDR